MKLALLWLCTIYLCLVTGWLLLRAAGGMASVFSELNPESITAEQLHDARDLIQRAMWMDATMMTVGVVGLVLVVLWMTDQTSHSK